MGRFSIIFSKFSSCPFSSSSKFKRSPCMKSRTRFGSSMMATVAQLKAFRRKITTTRGGVIKLPCRLILCTKFVKIFKPIYCQKCMKRQQKQFITLPSTASMLLRFHMAFHGRFSHVLDVNIFRANFTSCLTTRLSTLNPNRKLTVA